MALRILLADDSMTAQNMGKKILTDAGYEVVAVSNGAAAVKKIAEVSPHLCILDIYMPGYTGLEVCEKIKSAGATARMPVLLTVGKMEPYKPEEGARVRADGVIVKPFEASELLRAVHRFSQRLSGTPAPAPSAKPAAVPKAPPPPMAATPATYERTVKLTREQIQEYMEPGLQGWRTSTHAPETVAAPPGHTGAAAVGIAKAPAIPVDIAGKTKTASTTDGMPTFAGPAVADTETPAALAVVDLPAVPELVATTSPATATIEAAMAEALRTVETPSMVAELPPVAIASPAATLADAAAPSAAAVLPGFVDYLIAHPFASENAGADIVVPTVGAPSGTVDVARELSLNAQREEIASLSHGATTAEPAVISAVEGVFSTGAEILSDELRSAKQIEYDIPSVDPALEVAPEVSITPVPDPQFETQQDICVENATEQGLQPTSRAAESAGVPTSADPNLAPMEGLMDAVKPLEGGEFVIAEAAPSETGTQASAETAAETATAEASPSVGSAESIVEPDLSDGAAAQGVPGGKKFKKGKEMRAIPAAAPVIAMPTVEPSAAEVETTTAAETCTAHSVAEPAVANAPAETRKSDVSAEIAAVLDLLGQTTASLSPVFEDAAAEEPPATVIGAARIWMAEEVPLTDAEASMSLENEMRIAYAPKEVEPEAVAESIETAAAEVPHAEVAAIAPAEDTVRDDRNAPQPAMTSDTGASPPGTGASPTQELAAAMAAAFGGALPQEDLARAEETQSISEEVRRFALGDAYKPKPAGFGGAAIAELDDKRVAKEKLSAAIGRALDRLKPQLVAEILKELEGKKEEN